MNVRFHLEYAHWVSAPDHALAISGWCAVLDGRGTAAIEAHVNDRTVASASPGTRDDVAAHLGAPEAARSGFALRLPFIAEPVIDLVVTDSGRQRHRFHQIVTSELPATGPVLIGYDAYRRRLAAGDTTRAEELKTRLVQRLSWPPLSLLLPTFQTPARYLEECVASVIAQIYPNWELELVDDASTDPRTRAALDAIEKRDPRIRVTRLSSNGGIASATNVALARARGSFAGFLDHDDRLHPHALAEVAIALVECGADAAYTDEEKISEAGEPIIPFLKPAFSPEFLRGVMYIGHFFCARTGLLRDVGGCDPAYDGVQDFELALRVSERTSRFVHVPSILYQWRMAPTSSAAVGNIKGDMDRLQAKAVQAHLDRIGRAAEARALGGHRVRLSPRANIPRVVICIGRASMVDPATSGPHPVLDRSAQLNAGALEAALRETGAEYVVLVNETIRASDPAWIDALIEPLSDDQVAATGPVLLAPDGHVSAAGLSITAEGAVIPMMAAFAPQGDGYHGTLRCNREVAALPSACVAMRMKDLLETLSTAQLPSNDAEAARWCVERRRSGQRLVFCGAARVTTERDRRDPRQRERIESPCPADPYLDPHFEPNAADYRLRILPPARPLLHAWVETPVEERFNASFFTLQGWAWHSTASLHAVRLRFGDFEVAGVYGLARPDVAESFAARAPERCGFRISGRTPSRATRAWLEFQDTAGVWRLAEELLLPHRLRWAPAWSPGVPPQVLLAAQLALAPTHRPRELKFGSLPKWAVSQPRPAIAVVTPSLNQARYLGQAMHSVLSQRDVVVRYIVQDGGSTDGSRAIIAAQESRLAGWDSVADSGQTEAIARGLARTVGQPDDLMAWLNSDDMYAPGALRFVAGHFAAHPDVDVIYGNRILIDPESREIGRWYLPKHDQEVLRLYDFVPQETLFWRRRIWEKVGGIDPSFTFAMDWDLLLRFQAAGAKIVHAPYFLACFRVHPAQKTSAQIQDVGQREIDRLRERTFGTSSSWPGLPARDSSWHGLPAHDPARDSSARTAAATVSGAPTSAEIENHPKLIRYLRKSAWLEFAARFGYRGRAG